LTIVKKDLGEEALHLVRECFAILEGWFAVVCGWWKPYRMQLFSIQLRRGKWSKQRLMEEGSGKVQSLEQCLDTFKQTKSQRHLCRLKCWLFWALRILVKIVKS